MDWQKVRNKFEKEMTEKLRLLPGHREVPPELFEFRGLISHEIPETAPIGVFTELIQILLQGKPVDLVEMRRKYLEPRLVLEKGILGKNEKEFSELKKSAAEWVGDNLPEEKLQRLWKDHQTLLPRRYKIYADESTAFETIAADTLARYGLIKNLEEND